jgi:hypothetical protein
MKKYYVIFLVSLLASCGEKPPSDAQMLDKFNRNKAVFISLRDSLCKDTGRRTVMMDPEWSEPKVSAEQKKALYEIFNEIDVNGVYYDGDCSFRLPFWSVGFSGDGDYKYYVYRPGANIKAQALILDNLDEVDRSSLEAAFYLKPIGDDWYIEFDHWP